MDDLIKMPIGSVTVTLGIAEDGQQLYHCTVEGDLTFVQGMGLLAVGQRVLPDMYSEDDDG